MIKSTKTLILLGAIAFGATACDDQGAPEAASTSQDGIEQDAQEDIKVYRDAGEFALCLSGCVDNHCAYAMGGCLRATAECGGEEGCQEAYAACADQLIVPACQVESGTVELAGAVSCWGTFESCLGDSDNSIACLSDLYACAQEGCGDEGCGDVQWPIAANYPSPEDFDPENRP